MYEWTVFEIQIQPAFSYSLHTEMSYLYVSCSDPVGAELDFRQAVDKFCGPDVIKPDIDTVVSGDSEAFG